MRLHTDNLPIRVFGEPVVLRYMQHGVIASDGISYAAAAPVDTDAVAVVTPGVPERLQPEIAGDRWDDYFTFHVGSGLDRDSGDLLSVVARGSEFKVTLLRDWGDHSFLCVGEKQGQM